MRKEAVMRPANGTSRAAASFARVADLVSLLLLVVATWIALTGGSRYIIGGVVLSLRSAAVFLYAGAAIQAIRHLLLPRPSALDVLRGLDSSVQSKPALAAALRAFLATRPTVMLAGFLAVVTIGFPPNLKGELRVSNDPIINLPSRFDAGWYGAIALDGYQWGRTFERQQTIAFFPALPVLARGAGMLLGSDATGVPRESRMARVLWGAVLVSLASFLWGLVYFVRLGGDLIGSERAGHAAMLLAAYPFAIFYSAPYSEGLFFLGACAAFFHFRREQWGAACAWGLLVGLTRPNGCFLSIPLGIVALQQLRDIHAHRDGPPVPLRAALLRLTTAAAPGIGMLLFTGYLYQLTGIWFAWAKSHAAWGRTFQGLTPFASAFEQLINQPLMDVVRGAPYQTLNTLGLLFACVLVWPTFKRLGVAWGAFVLVNIAGPLLAGGVLSMGRLTSTLFPLFLALAAVLPPRAVPACTAAFALLQGLAAALFFTWRDLY